MTTYRRDALKRVTLQQDTHAGLWLDKYLESDETGAKDQLVHEVTKAGTPAAYNDFYKRWKQTLVELCKEANCREAEVIGRMAVNLGSEAVLETSIALHRTYGVPYISGSALKGLASHYVLHYQNKEEWGRDSEAFKTLFGDTTSAGYVTFYDALYVPGTGKGLAPDVITVHHPEYYQGAKPDYLHGKEAPPADWDSPIPIPFITATGRFMIALSGPAEWVKAAFEILELALEREGIGAKTSSGYGRMRFANGGASTQPAGESYASRKKTLFQEEPPVGLVRGTVMDVRESRYGMINPARGGKPVRIHVNQVTKGGKALRDGQIVEYRLGKFDGKDQAEDVTILLDSGS
jgi:CRISPR-associated protein Cmr6